MHYAGAATTAVPPFESHHARKHMQTHKHKLHTTVATTSSLKKEPVKPVNLPLAQEQCELKRAAESAACVLLCAFTLICVCRISMFFFFLVKHAYWHYRFCYIFMKT